MVGNFLRLRFALTLAGFRTGNVPRIIGTVFGLLAALVGGVGGLGAGVALRFLPDPWPATVLHLGLAAVLVLWVFGPLLLAGTDAAMDPVKFTLLPLGRRQLAGGLGIASLLGPGGIATVLTMVGVVIGMARPNAGAAFVVLGAGMFTVLCAVVSRLVVSLVGMGMRNRGTRDVLAVLVPVAIILVSQLPNVISQIAVARGAEQTEAGFVRAAALTRFLPSSFAAQTMLAGQDGRLLRALLELGAGLALVVVLGWCWALLLERVMTSPPATGDGAARSTGDRRRVLSRLLGRFPPRVRAVATKDVILTFREPSQRIGLIMMVVFGLAAVLLPAFLLRDFPAGCYIVAGVGMLLGLTSTNMYGYDGSSHWVNVAAGDDARSDLLGKLLARLLVYTPVLVLMAIVLPAVMAPGLIASVVGITLGVWFSMMGLALLQSVVAPYPIVYSEDSLMATNRGSFTAVVAQLVAFPVVAVLSGPFVALALLNLDHPLWPTVAGLGASVVGLVAMWALWLASVRYSAGRQPELLGMISKRAEA